MTASGPRSSRPISLIALVGAVAAIFGVVVLAASTIWDAHRATEAHAIETMQNLASALDHDIERNIGIYDLALKSTIDGLETPGLGRFAPQIRDRILFGAASAAQDLGAIYVLDREGTVLYHSQSPSPKRRSFADLEAFTIHRDHADIGLYISAPFQGAGNHVWSMSLSRRINRPDGSFGGVVLGTLRLTYFEQLFDAVELGPHGALALFRTDGPLVTRKPANDAQRGRDLSKAVVFKLLPKSPIGHFETAGVFDHVDRIYVYRKLEDFPFVLVAGTAAETIFAEWRQKAIFTGAGLAILLAIAGLLAFALRRELRRTASADALLRDAVESMSEGFVIFDKDDRLVTCNEAYKALYPKNAHLMVPGSRFEDIVRAGIEAGQSPDALGREEEWIAKRMHDHAGEAMPHEHRLDTGRWVLTSERRLPNGGMAGLRVDITALKQVQASLRESRMLLAQAQHVSRTGSVFRDFITGKTEWSEELCRIFGVDHANFTPGPERFLAMVHPQDRDRVIEAMRSSEQGVKPVPLEYRIILPDGQTRWVYREAEVLFAEGKPVGRISTYKDITERRAAEQHAAELEVQLRHSQKLEALGNLAGGIAHDLNNTLVPILALSKLGMKRFPEGSPDYKDLDTIARAGAHARDLVKQVLAFSRKEQSVKRDVDLAALVADALKMLRASLPATIRIIETIAPVPPIHADPTQLNQVVMNLVTNAAQAIGDRLGTITVTVRPAGDAASLAIADTGCGIDPADLERVFEPFFTTKQVGQGTGLGLAVVHGIVTDHGGRIECRSKPGEGSEFAVILPVAGRERASPEMQPAA
ncbi:MAG TPA: ATP-binding protein [Stellaceae bacterium]|nr:ATP-binding protein [Stellaceae bacterium]